MRKQNQPEESIYNWLDKVSPEQLEKKIAPLYVSRYNRQDSVPSLVKKESDHKIETKSNFLKKRANEARLATKKQIDMIITKKEKKVEKDDLELAGIKKDDVDEVSETIQIKNFKNDTKSVKGTPDYIKYNIEMAKNLKATVPQSEFIYRRRNKCWVFGAPASSESFRTKPWFAKLPKYMQRIKKQNELEKQKKADERREFEIAEERKFLPETERQDLLEKLRNKWSVVHRQFQSFPLSLNSFVKGERIKYLTQKLREIEKDIDLLQSNKIIKLK
ncbi:hypothetical protein SNEBB_003371 [Seison nebaliae]|nr:hypothetical protein SNEBB_003371 [Seison nebaliae]